VIFLGSETGDSHLIQLNPTGDMSVLDTYQNVAPITDAVLADLDNSDEPAVVTCSGGGRTGSLRIIKTGASIEELASLTGVDGVRDVFTLGGIDGYVDEDRILFSVLTSSIRGHSHLLLSFHSESKLIEMMKGSQFVEVTANDFPGIMRSEPTIVASNIKVGRDYHNNLAVQVTSTGVILFDVQSGMEHAMWRGAITMADISGDTVCLALKRGKVVKLCVDADRAKLNAEFVTISFWHSDWFSTKPQRRGPV